MTVLRFFFFQDDFKSEMEHLVRLNYTINMEYTSPSNHVFVSYPQTQLTVLSIRSHVDGQTLFGSRLKTFLLENNFPAILNHLVAFEPILSDVTHKQLLQDTYRELHGEGYVVEIIQLDRPSYLVKIKTQKYFTIHGDYGTADSPRSLFEAIITQNLDDLKALFKDDTETLKRINDMEQNIRPKYNRMIESIEQFYQIHKHLSKKDFARSITMNENMEIYLPLLMRLYAGEENDYKAFAIMHAKDLFDISGILRIFFKRTIE
jgi:T4 RnlA family RNA ligase